MTVKTVTFTLAERSSLLRAARKEMDRLNEDIIQYHARDGRQGSENRKLADYAAEELQQLASAVRKIWIASGELLGRGLDLRPILCDSPAR